VTLNATLLINTLPTQKILMGLSLGQHQLWLQKCSRLIDKLVLYRLL
jgi:hypothetical protein